MIDYNDSNQRTIAEFDWPFHSALDAHNRWVKLGQCIPWDGLAQGYHKSLSSKRGRPAKDARLVIGAVIIKHKLGLSDRETVSQIQENPYLQYFVGLAGYQRSVPFVPSLLVEVRKRMGDTVFEVFHQAIIGAVEKAQVVPQRSVKDGLKVSTQTNKSGDESEPESVPESKPEPESNQDPQGEDNSPISPATTVEAPSHEGKLIIDATVAEQAIRYPTDLSLLNEAREMAERIIDELYPHTEFSQKPRTYRRQARKDFLGLVKQRRPKRQATQRAIKQQLQYLRRNFGHIEGLMDCFPMGTALPLSRRLLYHYWVIQHVYTQQWEMYRNKSRRCDNRIVSIHQPYVRPIVRGKQGKSVEFGSKLSVSLTTHGLSRVDHLSWDAFHEGHDLQGQVERYHERYGCYPVSVIGDPIYGSRENRHYLKGLGIHFSGKPLGRPKQVTEANRELLKQLKAQRRADYLQRIPIEGKFGQAKNGYRLNHIRAKRADTSVAWINSIFLVMNLLILLKVFFVPKIRRLIDSITNTWRHQLQLDGYGSCRLLGWNRFEYPRPTL